MEMSHSLSYEFGPMGDIQLVGGQHRADSDHI